MGTTTKYNPHTGTLDYVGTGSGGGSGSRVYKEVPAGAINGLNVSFTLSNSVEVGTEEVFLNGVLQTHGAGNDYTVAGAVITFIRAPKAGPYQEDQLHVSYTVD